MERSEVVVVVVVYNPLNGLIIVDFSDVRSLHKDK